nr:hypothetical protein [Tanacetum cinerariifolium]
MLYPRFTKVIIDYFMSKDQSISRRNNMFWHTARDDIMFTSMRCVSRHEKSQVYGAILPHHLTNQVMLESIAYQTYYAYATREKAPKEKYVRKKAESDTSPKKKTAPTSKGAGVRPEVPDVPKYDSESDEESWTFSQDEDDADEETNVNDDSEETKSDNDGDDITYLNLSTYKADDEEKEEEKADDEEMYFDQRVSTPPEYELTEEGEEENKNGDDEDMEGRDNQDSDEDPFAGSNRGSKRRRSGKGVELSKEPTYKESKSTSSSKGSSSKKYTTSITKTKAADYGQVKWIEDKVSRIWSLDDQLYKLREGDFKRLRQQDIEHMLLLLVQNKPQLRRTKKINLTMPDTYRSDLKRMTPYTAYPDIQGIIYEDEMNRNQHQSDTKVFIITTEILLEATPNKLSVEKKIQNIDRLARSLLIQGLPNDIYSLIDSNKTAKDLWDALARHMLGSEYGEQDRKDVVLYEYETFKATEGELFLNSLQLEWTQYATMMRQNKNLMDINIDALYNILKQNQGDVNDAMGLKKKTIMVTSDPLALIVEKTKITALLVNAFNRRKFYSKPTNNNLRTSSASQSANKKQECVKSDDKKFEKKNDEKKQDMSKVKCYNRKKEGDLAKDCKKAIVKDYEYYKTKMLLAKKDKDEQVLLAEDHAWMESSSDSDQEINANMVFMAQIEKVPSDSEASSSSADDKIFEVSYYLSESEYETLEYYDNTTTYGLFVNDNDD